MGLTVTNTNTLSLLNILNRTSASQSESLQRLSTGSRINRGKDDPAGLVALRGLESALTATNAAITNNQRTDSLIQVADNALSEVAKLLGEIQSLVSQSSNASGITAAERAANQSQIDSAIASIDRIIGTTEFNGQRLLDGSFAIDVDGVNSSNIADVEIFSRNTRAGAQTLNIGRVQSAQLASAAVASGASFALNGNVTLQVAGTNGTKVIEVTSGASLAAIRDKINEFTQDTGVSASITGNRLNVQSTEYGSHQFVRVNLLPGSASGSGMVEAEDEGRDAVVTINGQKAAVDGLNVNYNNNGLSLKFNITETFNGSGTTTSFTVTEKGGATFQLGTDASTRATIGIDGLYSQKLGTSVTGYLSSLKSGGANDLLANPAAAAKIVGEAARQVANQQGRLGGFQKFQVGTALSQQNAAKEGLTAAIGTIKDVDYAAESAELNRQNVLLQSAISLLGVANQQSSQILALLR